MKKNIFKRDGPLIKVIAVVFAFSTLLSLFVVFPSAEVDDRAVPPEQLVTDLPAGSYTFDDYLDIPDILDTSLSAGVPFSFTTFIDEAGKVFNGYGLSFVFDNFSGFSLSYNLGNGLGTSTPTSHLVYTDSNGWVDNRDFNISILDLKPCFQKIFITENVQVPTWFYRWVMDNSIYDSSDELVKITSGTYSASKTIGVSNSNLSNALSSYLPFSVYNKDDNDIYYYDVMSFIYTDSSNGSQLEYISYVNTHTDRSWKTQYKNDGVSYGWVSDFYRTITITYDFYVSRHFYDVFTSIYHNISEYQAGYDAGYNRGYADGTLNTDAYHEGYEQGFTDGESGYSGLVAPFFSGIINALDSWNFFGTFSLWDFIVSTLTLMGMIWLLKLVAGG